MVHHLDAFDVLFSMYYDLGLTYPNLIHTIVQRVCRIQPGSGKAFYRILAMADANMQNKNTILTKESNRELQQPRHMNDRNILHSD